MAPTNKFVTLCSKIPPGWLPGYCKLLLLSMKFSTLAVTMDTMMQFVVTLETMKQSFDKPCDVPSLQA